MNVISASSSHLLTFSSQLLSPSPSPLLLHSVPLPSDLTSVAVVVMGHPPVSKVKNLAHRQPWLWLCVFTIASTRSCILLDPIHPVRPPPLNIWSYIKQLLFINTSGRSSLKTISFCGSLAFSGVSIIFLHYYYYFKIYK